MNQLPTFLVIGAAKAGTTSVARHLSDHPDVFVTDPKEPGHFTGHGDFAALDDYRRLFAGAASATARGEASTVYSRKEAFPGVPDRIAQLVPNVRLVYLVRDPMERLRSHYLMRLRLGRIEGSFQEFASANEWYTGISCYASQVAAYLECFEQDQLHVAKLEDLAVDPARVLVGVANHIGVDASFFDRGDAYAAHNAAPEGSSRRHLRLPGPGRRLAARAPSRLRRWLKLQLPTVELDDADLVLDEAFEIELRERFAADQQALDMMLPTENA